MLWTTVAVCAACVNVTSTAERPSLPAGVTYALEQSHYDITGESAAELHRAMLAKGPKLRGWPLYALTEFEVRWRLSEVRARGSCRPTASVQLTVRMLLPRWHPTDNIPSGLHEDWQRFEAALRTHEAGHRDLGVQAAREIGRSLRSGAHLQCGTALAADRSAHSIVNRYGELNTRYDEDTAHGQTQGVIWPPIMK